MTDDCPICGGGARPLATCECDHLGADDRVAIADGPDADQPPFETGGKGLPPMPTPPRRDGPYAAWWAVHGDAADDPVSIEIDHPRDEPEAVADGGHGSMFGMIRCYLFR